MTSYSPSSTPFALLLLLLGMVACASPYGSGEGEPARPLRPDSLESNGWDRDCDLVHVHLELAIDPDEKSVEGKIVHYIRGQRGHVTEIQLHGVGLEISRVIDSASRELQFEVNEPLVTLQLQEPLLRGVDERLTVFYKASPSLGLYFRESSKDFDGKAVQVWSQGQTEDHRHWMPLWDYPNERTSFSCELRVPKGLTALANGQSLGVQEHADGSSTYSWKLKQSIPTYLFAIAVGAWEKYEDNWNGLPVEYWVGPGTGEEKARRAFDETPAMLDYFTELLGTPYPYDKYAQVAVSGFVAGGMENASMTIQNDYVIATQAGYAELDGEPRLLVAHELAHQWFGDLVTCFGWSHLWLNEAWASYLEVLFEGQVLGLEMQGLRLERYRQIYLARGEATRKPLSEDWRTQLSDVRCNHEYMKGPWVLYMLEHELGSDEFWRAVQVYLERHANGLVTTEDFCRTLFDETGRNMEGFFEQWVEAGGHPEFEVRFTERGGGEERELEIHVDQVQRTSEMVPLFDVFVDVAVWDDRGEVRTRLRVTDSAQNYRVPLHGELRDVLFDVDCKLLCEIDLEKSPKMWAHQSRHANAALRWRAIDALEVAREAGYAVAEEALMRMAEIDDEVYLRRRALRSFHRSEYVPYLLDRVQREVDPLARFELLRMLSSRQLPSATIQALENSFVEQRTVRTDRLFDRMKARVGMFTASED